MPTYGPGPAAANTVLNVTVATVLKATPGVLYLVSVNGTGSAAGAVYDANTTGGAIAANLIGTLAETATAQPLLFNWRCLNGILVVPPTGAPVSVNFV